MQQYSRIMHVPNLSFSNLECKTDDDGRKHTPSRKNVLKKVFYFRNPRSCYLNQQSDLKCYDLQFWTYFKLRLKLYNVTCVETIKHMHTINKTYTNVRSLITLHAFLWVF